MTRSTETEGDQTGLDRWGLDKLRQVRTKETNRRLDSLREKESK